jgi:hypothetical protein
MEITLKPLRLIAFDTSLTSAVMPLKCEDEQGAGDIAGGRYEQ